MRRRPVQLRQELKASASAPGSRSVVAGGLLLLAALAVGAAVGILWVSGTAPESLAASPQLDTAAVTPEQFRDPHQASFSMTTAPPQSLRSGTSGVLTSFPCREGGSFTSGTALFSVSGSAVVGFATATPLWRDIEIGDEGTDVAALQAELARLGQGIDVDGYWGWADADAFTAVMVAAGAPQPDSAVRLAAIAWLPAPAVTASTCLLGAGSNVSAGQSLADLPVTLASAQLTDQPVDSVPGDRVVVIGIDEYEVPNDGVITDPVTLAAILESSPYRQALSDKATSDVPYDYLLASAVAVSSIAPSAIYDVDGGRGCVQEGGEPVSVNILASQLGLALVVPARQLEYVDLHPRQGAACR